MKILLEELEHQTKALDCILRSFPGIENNDVENHFSNPLIKNAYKSNHFIDVKMETGTGKTYVHTKLIYELHQLYGIFKFILVVPSPAIKAGTKNFIESEYANRHFSETYGNTKIELSVINSGDFKSRGGRRNYPPHLSSFVEGSSQSKNTIHVMLINADMLRSVNMTRDDYDQTLIGGYTSPIDALKDVKPVIIIDEPHRFPRHLSNYKAIEKLNPQTIIRFGATFPEVKKGRGKNTVISRDYYRGEPQYDLNAVESFNNGLVKGVDIYYPQITEIEAKNIYNVDSVSAKELVLKKGRDTWNVGINELLSNVDKEFEGDVTYAGTKELSNGLLLEKGMKLIPSTFKSSYQELVIKDAINKHFILEQDNFMRENSSTLNRPKIKTLSLYFIDNIRSYRNDDGWIKKTFEIALRNKLQDLILEYEFKKKPREIEYLSFLRATLNNLNEDTQTVHAGYFGEDRGNSDEAIQEEVEDILENKNKMLSFKDDKGKWITRRFLFSKWTLREGWDNPNVFVIAKLRTSGSETSKIQEVGRGLRLPVDETGYRVKHNEWNSRLAFLIGYDEKDFAKKLMGEINNDIKIDFSIFELTSDMIEQIVTERKKQDINFTEDVLLEDLDKKGIITRANKFNEDVVIDGDSRQGYEWLEHFYPEINSVSLTNGIIRENDIGNIRDEVKLKKENWNKVKSLWKKFSKAYMIEFDRVPGTVELIAEDVLKNRLNYEYSIPYQVRQSIINDGNKVDLVVREEGLEERNVREGIPYGDFIISLHLRTNIPIKLLHSNILFMLKHKLNSDNNYLSELTLKNLVREFKERFENSFAQSYQYYPLNFSASTSIYDSYNDVFIDSLSSGLVGVNYNDKFRNEERYLYELPPLYYDSANPEKTLLEHKYGEYVTVFGKLPKSSIKVPKYTGGTTTPDLIYVIETKKKKEMFLLVETKAEDMRLSDDNIIKIHKKFFNFLDEKNVIYTEAVTPEQVYSKLTEIYEGDKNEED